METFTHEEAAKILGIDVDKIKNLLITKKLIRAERGKITKESVLSYLQLKKEKDIYEIRMTPKNFRDMWAKIIDLEQKTSLLIQLYDDSLEELPLDQSYAKALINAADNFDFKEKDSLKKWALLCNRISFNNLLFMTDYVKETAWYSLYKLCCMGEQLAKKKKKIEELILWNKARKNIHELSVLLCNFKGIRLVLDNKLDKIIIEDKKNG